MNHPDDKVVPETPKWREDFPFETEGDDFITRRDFTRFLCIVSAGFATGNAWIWGKSLFRKSKEPPAVEICGTADLQPGKWMTFRYPDEKTPAMLIRRLNGDFIAFLQKCTHLACPVAYEANRDNKGEALTCHCHNGVFDINTGEGLAGPPKELRPLPRLKLEIRGERIYAVGYDFHRGIGHA